MIRKFGLVSAMALATALGGCAMMPDLGFGTASDASAAPQHRHRHPEAAPALSETAHGAH